MRRMGRAEFVRADIRNPFIAKVIRNSEVDTVVHAAAASYAPRSGGRATLKEINVMGAMQLFAACQKAPTVRRVVLKSTSEVYGSNALDPVMFTEGSSARRPPRDGFRPRQHRHRGLRARPGPAPPGHRGHHPAAGQHDRPRHGYRAVALSGRAVGADRARPRCAAAVAARAGCAGCPRAGHHGLQVGHVQHRRQRHHHDVAGDPALRPRRCGDAHDRRARPRFAGGRRPWYASSTATNSTT